MSLSAWRPIDSADARHVQHQGENHDGNRRQRPVEQDRLRKRLPARLPTAGCGAPGQPNPILMFEVVGEFERAAVTARGVAFQSSAEDEIKLGGKVRNDLARRDGSRLEPGVHDGERVRSRERAFYRSTFRRA